MPFYQFTVHGRDEQVTSGQRGFWTTRHAFDVNPEAAAEKVLALLVRSSQRASQQRSGPARHRL